MHDTQAQPNGNLSNLFEEIFTTSCLPNGRTSITLRLAFHDISTERTKKNTQLPKLDSRIESYTVRLHFVAVFFFCLMVCI